MALGHNENALGAFLTAGIEHNDPKPRYDLVELYIRLGKREEALHELQTLRELHDPLADNFAKPMNSDSAIG
jgi:hypothetical protein